MPKLSVQEAALLDKDEEMKIKAAFDILKEVQAQAEELGLPQYPKPTTSPEPLADKDIEGMPNAALGQLYVRYMAYAQYVSGQLVLAEVGYKIAVSALKMLDAKLRTKLFSQEVPKAEVASRVKENPLYTEGEMEVLRLYATKEILGAHYKAYDKQASSLSRIISLRELEFEKEMVANGKVGGRKSKPQIPRDFRRDGE